jgi:hypothetical protein
MLIEPLSFKIKTFWCRYQLLYMFCSGVSTSYYTCYVLMLVPVIIHVVFWCQYQLLYMLCSDVSTSYYTCCIMFYYLYFNLIFHTTVSCFVCPDRCFALSNWYLIRLYCTLVVILKSNRFSFNICPTQCCYLICVLNVLLFTRLVFHKISMVLQQNRCGAMIGFN